MCVHAWYITLIYVEHNHTKLICAMHAMHIIPLLRGCGWSDEGMFASCICRMCSLSCYWASTTFLQINNDDTFGTLTELQNDV